MRAALIAQNRQIFEIWLQSGKENKHLDAIKKRAKEQGVPVRVVDESQIAGQTDGSSHGGVLAFVSERKFLPLEDLSSGPQAAFLVMLDGVEDPYNFAQALRAVYACGAHGLILRPRNWTSAASTVSRASAGTSEFMRMAIAESDEAILALVKQQKLKLVCSDLSSTAISPSEANLKQGLLLVIGGEKRGISKPLLKAADMTLEIPYGRKFKQSLGVTSSAAILAYEVMMQRQQKSPKRS